MEEVAEEELEEVSESPVVTANLDTQREASSDDMETEELDQMLQELHAISEPTPNGTFRSEVIPQLIPKPKSR
eukprot:5555021-Amphidinium_carterae.1